MMLANDLQQRRAVCAALFATMDALGACGGSGDAAPAAPPATAPAITVQPQNVTAGEGSQPSVSVTASSDGGAMGRSGSTLRWWTAMAIRTSLPSPATTCRSVWARR